MIKNERPYTNENGAEDYQLITNSEYLVEVMAWISENIFPVKKTPCQYNSYSLKHMFQEDTGIYLTNNQFKDAMLLSGYYPINPNILNWEYLISKKSPAIYRRLHGEVVKAKNNRISVGTVSQNNGIIGNVVGGAVNIHNSGFDKNPESEPVPNILDAQKKALIKISENLNPIELADVLAYVNKIRASKTNINKKR